MSEQGIHKSDSDCSEQSHSMMPKSSSQKILYDFHNQLRLINLPTDVLQIIFEQLPTVSLIACATVHTVFADLIGDTFFLNVHTRSILGFPRDQRDITYDIVPKPVSPVQNLWYQAYLHRAAPSMVGLVQPGVQFYDLLCFKHLLDSWILQGHGYKYWMFLSDVIGCVRPPPLVLSDGKRFLVTSKSLIRILTKMALCYPDILLLTINNFETIAIRDTLPSTLEDVWERGVPSEYKQGFAFENTCEVVSSQRRSGLASFFITIDSKDFIAWSGVVDFSTYSLKDAWSVCRFSSNTPLKTIRKVCHDLFQQFIQYVDPYYISFQSTNAFFFRSLSTLVKQRKIFKSQMQDMLVTHAHTTHRKMKKLLSAEECSELKTFLDGTSFVGCDQHLAGRYHIRLLECQPSKTLEVALQRYLHRYLNYLIGLQVYRLYEDPICHRLLCSTCHNTISINNLPFGACMEHVNPNRIPLKIWPPHLLYFGKLALPALAKLVYVDIELWKRQLLDEPLSEKVEQFIRQALTGVHLNFHMNPSRRGVIGSRIIL